MAICTEKTLRNQVLYSVNVRQYSREGTFAALKADLPRIRDLGADIIWLLPIHPAGEVRRIGELGSPYAVRDYRGINPEFGSMRDFEELVDAIHGLGMHCIIDVVYNHTSPDSVLAREHPEWFYHKPDGSFGGKTGDWPDIIDLDYDQRGLWEYQIETLKLWAKIVDGFRCDVAPLVPLEFWLRARAEVEEVRPGCLWLSESVDPPFLLANRARGMVTLSDSEIFQAFDVAYEYDVYTDFIDLLAGRISLGAYADAVNRQEHTFPDNYVKLRFLENHDRPRAAYCIPDPTVLRNWTAFLYFQKGMTLLYNGQERACVHRPSLFDRDSIEWERGCDLTPLMKRLYEIKKRPIFADSSYTLRDGGNGNLIGCHEKDGQRMIGLFNTQGTPAVIHACVPDGNYTNLIDKTAFPVESGLFRVGTDPVIFEA